MRKGTYSQQQRLFHHYTSRKGLLQAGKRQISCRMNGKEKTGPFAWLIKFFHSIQYFFKNLFK